MTRWCALAAAAGFMAAGAAQACMPVPYVPSAGPLAGERCALVWHVSEIRAVGLSPATDLGVGVVMQDIFDGNACYWEANLIVHDCAGGAALVIGPDRRALATEPRRTGIDRIVDALQAAPPPTLEALRAAAAREGYATVLTVPRGQPIEVNGRRLPVDCACRSLYPGLGPGN